MSKLESEYLHIMNAFRVIIADFKYLGRAHKKAGEGLLIWAYSDREEWNGCKHGPQEWAQSRYGKELLYCGYGEALEL